MAAETRLPLNGGITKITSLRTGKVSYEARWAAPTGDGKRQHGHKRFPGVKAARAHKSRMEAAIAEQRYDAPSRLTVAEYAETWFARREREWKSSTRYTRRKQWARYIEPRFGGMRIVAVSRHHCQAFADELAATYKPTMVGTVMSILTGILRSASRDGIILRNVAEGLDLPSSTRTPRTLWSTEQVGTFLHATRDHEDHAVYALILATGCRIGEALALQWTNVDLDAAQVTFAATLRRDGDTGYRSPAPGTKSSPGRTVPLTASSVVALRRHQAIQAEQRRASKTWDIRGYVFTDRNGAPARYEYRTRRLRAVQETMGETWPILTFHALRHIVATRLAQANVHPSVVSMILGHSRVSVTLDVYTWTTIDDLATATAILDQGDNIAQK